MGRQMSYRVFYGDGVTLADCDLHADETNVRSNNSAPNMKHCDARVNCSTEIPEPLLRFAIPPANC